MVEMEAPCEANGKEEEPTKRKILCLHGFRTSGDFFKKQISRWDPSTFAGFDLVFLDGIFPAGGKSDIEGIYPPPYYEWFQFKEGFTDYENLDKCISFLCEYITGNGPFEGFLGFSQGAALSALLLGYQAQGKILQDHPPMKLFVSVSGCKFRDPAICDIAYREPIKVKSLHLVGEKDWLREPSEELATAFDDPLVVRHPHGHTVPRLGLSLLDYPPPTVINQDAAAVKQLSEWTRGILQGADVVIAGAAENGEVGKESNRTAAAENGEVGKESNRTVADGRPEVKLGLSAVAV